MTSATGLPALGADVLWPDAAASAALEHALPPGSGRLGELARWVAGAQGSATPHRPRNPRLLLLDGPVSAVAAQAAERHGIGIDALDVPADLDRAAATGTALADKSADEGCELLVVAAPSDPAAAVVVCLVGNAEPVALLPRGAAAVDTAGWIAGAVRLRDALRRVAGLRERPDELLAALASPVLACAVELIMRAAARRTPVIVDGPLAAAAAVLCQDVQVRSGQWVRCADTHPDPVHRRAVDDLAHTPVLDLGLERRDGLAGLLAAGVVLTAADLGDGDEPDTA